MLLRHAWCDVLTIIQQQLKNERDAQKRVSDPVSMLWLGNAMRSIWPSPYSMRHVRTVTRVEAFGTFRVARQTGSPHYLTGG